MWFRSGIVCKPSATSRLCSAILEDGARTRKRALHLLALIMVQAKGQTLSNVRSNVLLDFARSRMYAKRFRTPVNPTARVNSPSGAPTHPVPPVPRRVYLYAGL